MPTNPSPYMMPPIVIIMRNTDKELNSRLIRVGFIINLEIGKDCFLKKVCFVY